MLQAQFSLREVKLQELKLPSMLLGKHFCRMRQRLLSYAIYLIFTSNGVTPPPLMSTSHSVDASNAFNSHNRNTSLHNIRFLCPALSTILINYYRSPTELFIDGEVLLSQEGTTQGDPLAMPMYALANIPLIKSLPESVSQVWHAG